MNHYVTTSTKDLLAALLQASQCSLNTHKPTQGNALVISTARKPKMVDSSTMTDPMSQEQVDHIFEVQQRLFVVEVGSFELLRYRLNAPWILEQAIVRPCKGTMTDLITDEMAAVMLSGEQEEMVSKNYGKRFTPFPRLPLELRRKIWLYTLPGERYIEFAPFLPSNPPRFDTWFLKAPEKAPEILYVCHEAMTIVKEFYIPINSLETKRSKIWCNFSTDVFCSQNVNIKHCSQLHRVSIATQARKCLAILRSSAPTPTARTKLLFEYSTILERDTAMRTVFDHIWSDITTFFQDGQYIVIASVNLKDWHP